VPWVQAPAPTKKKEKRKEKLDPNRTSFILYSNTKNTPNFLSGDRTVNVKSKFFFLNLQKFPDHLISLTGLVQRKGKALESIPRAQRQTVLCVSIPCPNTTDGCKPFTHLVDGVQKIDTVLIPTQHPAFSKEA
jgi:hypothetical protein